MTHGSWTQMLHLWLHLKSDTWAKWRQAHDRRGATSIENAAAAAIAAAHSQYPRRASTSGISRGGGGGGSKGGGAGVHGAKGGKKGMGGGVKMVRYRLEGAQDRVLANWKEPARKAVQVSLPFCWCVGNWLAGWLVGRVVGWLGGC